MKIRLLHFSIVFLLAFNTICASEDVDVFTRGAQEYTHIDCELRPLSERASQISPGRPHPHLPAEAASKSTNWSGYAALTNTSNPTRLSVSAIAGTWTVPAISASTPAATTYSSIWIGIDGFASNSVEQIGTEHDFGNGRQDNYAWFEMYPNYPFEIMNFPVNVGDSISASVVYMGSNIFVLAIFNNTRSVYSVIPTSYTTLAGAARSSAEWIVEAPYENGVLPLSHFSTISFSNCVATINNVIGSISNPTWINDQITMTASNGTAKAVPSALGNNGQNFTVAWAHQ